LRNEGANRVRELRDPIAQLNANPRERPKSAP
jgi:hypothetical protein